MSTAQHIGEFVSGELLGGRTVEVEENLLEEGAVDSLGMIRLVTWIEEIWSVAVPPEDFTIENFHTVAAVARYVDAALARRDTGI